MLATNVMIY